MKQLSLTGKSGTAPVATRKAKPWPGQYSKISMPMSNSAGSPLSFRTGARGTKKGSKRRGEQTCASSLESPSLPKLHGLPCPWHRRCSMHEAMASRNQTSLHRSAGAWPLRFRGAGSAPDCINRTATLRRLMKSATCRAVQPAMSVAFSGSSRRMSSLTMASDPLRQAACKQVVPLVSQASMFAPRTNNHLTTARLADEEKVNNKRSTSLRSSSVSWKTAPAGSHVLVSSKISLSP
mmetsp:Transcript_11806/g.32281  ORF Transcript_11806/g.32281 Transcript_11806/m.32281 type:complete len:236 (+) Transcript_11806:930-1637(+)